MSWFFLVTALIVTAIVLTQTLSKRLPEKESVFWMLGCLVIILLSIFPKSMDNLAKTIGIDYPPSLYFLIAILFLAVLIFRLYTQMDDNKRKSDALARRVSLLEKRIEDLEDNE
ncbi:MAG: DUF2304 domain-containing protein [Clostridiales bacterium]|nr:DUF2304 domain-containing protein [Clostridiales bacterium]